MGLKEEIFFFEIWTNGSLRADSVARMVTQLQPTTRRATPVARMVTQPTTRAAPVAVMVTQLQPTTRRATPVARW